MSQIFQLNRSLRNSKFYFRDIASALCEASPDDKRDKSMITDSRFTKIKARDSIFMGLMELAAGN